MRGARSKKLFALVGLCLIIQGALHSQFIYPNWKKNFSPNQGDIQSGLAPDQFLLALAGFRELIAGILWVRADAFFDSGNFDAILPIIRLVTWLDPRQIDVYATGMWHIAYNFTDEESRSDRRYLPAALALGAEGSKKNPETYELFFETGWLWYNKIDDNYDRAVKWMQEANAHEDVIPARRNILAGAYLRNGQLKEALDYYYQLLSRAEERANTRSDFDPQARNQRDVIENNIDVLLVRMAQRGWFAQQKGEFEKRLYDTRPPFDVNFSARVTIVEPLVLRVEGSWAVKPVGTRIRVVLRDEDFPNAIPAGAEWDKAAEVTFDTPKGITFMQDQLYPRNQRFDRTVDMSKDPTMYSFEKDKYVLEFYYNPRSAPPHIQDKFGWNGDGMTDKLFLSKDARPGANVLYCKLELTKDQIKRYGEWADKVPVVQTPNFKQSATNKGALDIIRTPSIRN